MKLKNRVKFQIKYLNVDWKLLNEKTIKNNFDVLFLSNFSTIDFFLQNDVVFQFFNNKNIFVKERKIKFFDNFTNKENIIVIKKSREKVVKINKFNEQIYVNYKKTITSLFFFEKTKTNWYIRKQKIVTLKNFY